MKYKLPSSASVFLMSIVLTVFACIGGLGTHWYVCAKSDTAVLFIMGLLFFPVGIAHGWYNWILWLFT